MAVNANPQEIFITADEILDSYMKIYESTSLLQSELNHLASSIDDEAYNIISSKLKNTVLKVENAHTLVETICKKLIKYAEILEEENRDQF